MLIVDEYDRPIKHNFFEDEKIYNDFNKTLEEFYLNIKYLEKYLKYVYFTGILNL